MKKVTISLKAKILMLEAAPAVLLGILLSLFCTYTAYSNSYGQVYNELRAMCICCYEFISSENMEKGGSEDSILSYFQGVKQGTATDLSLFDGDTRYITTITDTEGNMISGTKAAPEVKAAVLQDGRDFFSDDVMVNGTPYFGYYMPVMAADGNVSGMTFAGKSKESVDKIIRTATFGTFVISASAIVLATAIGLAFSARLVNSIKMSVDFLNAVSAGDMECKPGKKLLLRTDEIGAMGRSAVKLQQSLKYLISSDPLTELLNRRECNRRLAEIYSNGEPEYTAIMGDIDFFKKFNDEYGHDCGDEVLKTVSRTFRKCIGSSGFASRWGGEEFLFIIEEGGYDNAIKILEDIQARLEENGVDYNGDTLKVTMTFGVQKYEKGMKSEEVVRLADEKLYYGKTHGRNCAVEVIPGQY